MFVVRFVFVWSHGYYSSPQINPVLPVSSNIWDKYVGRKFTSYKQGSDSPVETWNFSKEGDLYVGKGTKSGTNKYRAYADRIQHIQHARIFAQAYGNDCFNWSHGYITCPGQPQLPTRSAVAEEGMVYGTEPAENFVQHECDDIDKWLQTPMMPVVQGTVVDVQK